MVRVRVVVGVEVPAVWGDDCAVKQVRQQGVLQAEEMVHKALADARGLSVLGVESLEMTLVSEAER